MTTPRHVLMKSWVSPLRGAPPTRMNLDKKFKILNQSYYLYLSIKLQIFPFTQQCRKKSAIFFLLQNLPSPKNNLQKNYVKAKYWHFFGG